MKKIEAIIRKSKFVEVKEALHKVEVNFFSYWDVTGVGNEKEGHVYRGITYSTSEIQRRYLSIVVNDDFVEILESNLDEMNLSKDTPILFLCRSGARSAKAASIMTNNGWNRCFNIAYGFEGDPNENHHRANTNGWKFEGLPWIQL